MCVFLFIWFFFMVINLQYTGKIDFFFYLKLKILSKVSPKHTTNESGYALCGGNPIMD